MTALKSISYLSREQYNTLYTTGSIVIGGVTYTYNENNLYIVENYIDDEMSDTSENAVQNKVIKAYVDGKTIWDNVMSDTSENAVQNKVIKQYIDDHLRLDPEVSDTSTNAVTSKAIAEYVNKEIVDILNKVFN